MATREFTILVAEIEKLKKDLAGLLEILMQLKVIKIKLDVNGNPVYDTGNDEQSEVQ
jgi:hypothetical protein